MKGDKRDIAKSEKAIDQAVKTMADREVNCLIFSMAGKEYTLGILKIKEII